MLPERGTLDWRPAKIECVTYHQGLTIEQSLLKSELLRLQPQLRSFLPVAPIFLIIYLFITSLPPELGTQPTHPRLTIRGTTYTIANFFCYLQSQRMFIQILTCPHLLKPVARALVVPHPILLKFCLLCALVSSPTLLSFLLCVCPIPSSSASLFKVNHGVSFVLFLNFPVFPFGESLALLCAGLPTAAWSHSSPLTPASPSTVLFTCHHPSSCLRPLCTGTLFDFR